MASLPPSRFNNYRATTSTKLTADVWNASVGDLALRMVAVEIKATGYDQLVADGIGIALDRINEALTPAVTQVQAIIDQTNTYLLQLQGNFIAASLVATTPTMRFVTDTQISKISEIDMLVQQVSQLVVNAGLRGRGFYLGTM